MSSLSATDSRKGQGLEVLDVGSCSLTESALTVLNKAPMTNLRSLTIHHNPLSRSVPNYAENLQGSSGFPKLAIIDNKRVVERVKRPEGEKKKNGKAKKGQASGANVLDGSAKMREWGGKVEGGSDGDGDEAVPALADDTKGEGKKEKKRKREEDPLPVKVKGDKVSKPSKGEKAGQRDSDKPVEKRSKSETKPGKSAPAQVSALVVPAALSNPSVEAVKLADPSALTATSKKHSKNETGVYGVVEVVAPKQEKEKSKNKVKKEKRKGQAEETATKEGGKSDGGIDLKEMFGKSDTGLGVGGW